MADESVRSHATESLEELSGEWMRQQLQEAAVNTRPPAQEPARQAEAPAPAPSPDQPDTAATAPPAAPSQPAAAAGATDEVLAGLAQSVSQAVVSAVSQLEGRRAQETHSLEQAVRDQQQRLENAVRQVEEMQGRFDKLTRLIEEQQSHSQRASDMYERLAGELSEIQRRDASRESVLEELRRETLDLSVSVSDRQDQTSGRLDLQQADIDGLKAAIAELKPGVEHAGERLDRHSQAIRAVFEAERRREQALEQLSEAAANLKGSTFRLPEGLSEELL